MGKKGGFHGCLLFLIAFMGAWLCAKMIQAGIGLPIDDAYIFKRYVLNIIAGHGFSFNPGEPSYGCSSLLWTGWLAVLTKIFGPGRYFAIAQWSGIIFTALAVWYLLKIVSFFTGSRWLALTAGFLAWASAATFMNAVSGMESGLFSCLVMISLWRFVKIEEKDKRNGLLLGLSSGLAFLTRPEALYFVIALSGIWLYKLLRKNKSAVITWLTFLVGFAIPALPYLVWMKVRFHQLLPYTFRAKIFSADPELLNRTLNKKFLDGLGFVAEGWNNLLVGWKTLGWIIIILALILFIYALIRFVRKPKQDALVLIGGWMLLPFAYGYAFPVSPHFGGYYQRYIASVWLVMVLLGVVGFEGIFSKIKLKGILYLLVFLVVFGYGHPIAIGQFKSGREVYVKEVGLNQGIRMEAANWLKEKTPANAKVLTGHTGLGVVGGESERYVYDLGGLVNLDLLPYLEGTKSLTEKRWEKILVYVCDRGIDYYTNFAPLLGVDPAQSPGFIEETRIGAPGEPTQPYDQIRIYRIDRNLACKPKQ